VQEALMFLYQVCGAAHVETAKCSALLATVLFRAGDQTALEHQKHALALFERLRGVDHPDTIHAHGNLALFQHALGHHSEGFSHMRRCLQWLEVVGGRRNAESGSIYLKLGRMYRSVAQGQMAMSCFYEAMQRALNDRIAAIEALQALASVKSEVGAHSEALKLQKKSFELCLAQFGPKHQYTSEAKALYKFYTTRLVQARQASTTKKPEEDTKEAKEKVDKKIADKESGKADKAGDIAPDTKVSRQRRRRRRRRRGKTAS